MFYVADGAVVDHAVIILDVDLFTFTRHWAAACTETAGPFTATIIPPPTCLSPIGICTLGTLGGQHPETYSFVMDTAVPIGGNQYTYTGQSLITRTHGGATLTGQDTGIMTIAPTTMTFVTTVNITGGTKQFKNATGQYVATGQADLITGEVTGTFTSTVCK